MLEVFSPCDGQLITSLVVDDAASLEQKVASAVAAQKRWANEPRRARVALLEALSAAVTAERDALIALVVRDAGKTAKEAAAEVDGSADILRKTIADATLPDLNGMARTKERPPVGVVGLITSFNFPLAVANWSIGPALLAGNAVLWKPSEKTPLVAVEYARIWAQVAGEYAGLMQLVIGGREIGSALVSHEQVDMISATGSVAMGQAIKATLAAKKNNSVPPILELGGNNGVIISQHSTPEHRAFAVGAVLQSFLGTSGQRCTNTRRLIVQRSVLDEVMTLFTQRIEAFLASGVVVSPLSGASNDYGYAALIDADAKQRFDTALAQAANEGGTVWGGGALSVAAGGHYVAPALACMPSQTPVMHTETFAPLLYVVPYDGFDEAITLLNAPENAGLVGGIYTQNTVEAEHFARACNAGHVLINSPRGTGTPAFGMGFGGNRHSGEGEILNAADPLAAFTRRTHYRRIASNTAIEMNQ
jgi:aldehyde dehydrogenase (NAD+)